MFSEMKEIHAKMTLRYLKTLSARESLRINQEVDFKW